MKVEPSELAGLAEVAALLGVSRERVRQLRAERADFPKPVADLQATPVWRRGDVEAWDAHRQRRPGRRPEKLDDAAVAAIVQSARLRPAAELAREYGVSPSHISRIRSGERRQPIEALRRLRHDEDGTR